MLISHVIFASLWYSPRAQGWTAAVGLGRCPAVWYWGSSQRRTAGSSWRPPSFLLHSPLRSRWSGCWSLLTWCGRHCLPGRSWKGGQCRGSVILLKDIDGQHSISYRVVHTCKHTVTHVHKCNLHVGWKLKKVDAHVNIHLLLGVDSQLFVGVHWH